MSKKDKRLVSLTHTQQLTFSGPLPPPSMLLKYNEVFPGCGERIVAMAESQSNHRQDIEKSVVKSNIRNESRGQLFAFLLALAAIIGGFFLVAIGKDVAGLSIIITDAAVLAGTFIYKRVSQRKELAAKRQVLIPQR
ncbi:MAG: DUF2335 domain-containing protein [Acidobacteria bacterium]|nr:DUF2335 domain-containing protein [Acidobacteriota bacterium]